MDFTKRIETERLILRKAKIEDCNDIFHNYAKREKVTEFLSWQTHKSLDDTKDYLQNVVLPGYESQSYCWFIELRENHQIVGAIDLVKVYHINDKGVKACEIGWVLSNDFWGQGIMPEAARAVIEYLKTQNFVRIVARHNVKNLKSGRVMQKIGMKFEGVARKGGKNNKGELVDTAIYSFIIGEDEILY